MRTFPGTLVSVILFVLPTLASAADVCKSVSAASPVAVQTRCAQRIAAAACRTGSSDRVTAVLARKLDLPVERLTLALNRFQVPATKRWCGLTDAQMAQILATARRKPGVAEHRQEWIRFTHADENGYIPPDGLARALEQRKSLVPPAGRSRIAPSSAALPATPAGWTSLNAYIHPVGRVNDLLIHPTSTNTMWAGTDGGGIWKTTDGGTTWQASNDFLASLSISSLVMSPSDPSTIYAGTGPIGTHTGLPGVGVLKSTDGGSTWSLLPSTSPALNADWQSVFQLAIHPTNSATVIAATFGGAYITTNGGTNWTEIAAASTLVNNVAIHPANANLRVLAMDDGTVRIATDGSTYNTYTIAASSSSYTRIALAPSNQSVMYALVLSGGTTTLYRSSTGGTTWSPVPPPTSPIQALRGQLYYTGGLWVDPTNANHIAVAEFWAGVTSDASAPSPVWAEAANGWVDFHGVVGDPGYNGTSNKKVYFFDDGGLYRWTDVDTIASVSPSFLSPNGIVATQAYSAAGRGGNVIFGAQDVASRYYRTSGGDPTQKWRFGTLGGHDGAATAADSTNPAILYGSTQFLGIHRSTDGGVTNSFICQGISDITCGGYTGNASFIAPFVLDPNNQSRMLAGATALWRSNNVASGSPPTWTSIHSGAGVNFRVTAIAVAASDSNVVWVAYSNGSVYKTANATDPAPTWTQVTNVPVGVKLGIHIDRTNSQRVYIGLAGFFPNRLVTTPDAGANWANVGGLPSASVFTIEQHPANASWLYVGTSVGLFASENSGSTWSASNEGPATVEVQNLKWYSDSPAVLLVATFGRGVWKATVTPALTPPTGLTATATSPTSVSLTWNTSGATSYVVYRSSAFPSFSPITTTGGTTYIDTTAIAGKSYLYAVRASDGVNESAESNRDLATTVLFTDPTLTAGVTVVKAVHMTEARTAVDAVRTLAVLPAATYTPPAIAPGAQVMRLNLTELRTALDAARSTLGLTAVSYTDPTITAGSTPIKAAHIGNVRQGVQ